MPTQNQLRLLRTITFSFLFCRSILQSNLKKSTRGHHLPKFLKKKLTVDGGMAVQIPQLFGRTSSKNRCYPVHTSQSTPTDTYSHFNVEILLITISFFHLFIFAHLFSLVVLAPSRLSTKSQCYGVGYDHHHPYAEFGSNPTLQKKVF